MSLRRENRWLYPFFAQTDLHHGLLRGGQVRETMQIHPHAPSPKPNPLRLQTQPLLQPALSGQGDPAPRRQHAMPG